MPATRVEIATTDMPPTRLELRWRRVEPSERGLDLICDYQLVLELDDLDIRGEVYEDGELVRRDREKRLDLGGTRSEGSIVERNGELRIPFRDCSHIQWDAKRLGLRMFVTGDGRAQELIPTQASELFY